MHDETVTVSCRSRKVRSPGHPVCNRRCVREASGKRRTSATSLTSAFTLIELLVVTAIIATLAAILFTVFAQVREPERAGTWAASQPGFTLNTITLAQIDAPADKILVVEKGILACTDASRTVAYAGMNFDPGQWNWIGRPGQWSGDDCQLAQRTAIRFRLQRDVDRRKLRDLGHESG